MTSVAIVGAGIFGVTAALALRRRGWDVTLVDPGPIPHPLAESTDISKVVRLDYGADDDYLAAMEIALPGWRRWNAAWERPLFHETGVAFLCRAPMAPGGFERESYERLVKRGHAPERLDAAAIAARFPAWSTGRFMDGYYNSVGGWAESGNVVSALAREAESLGVRLLGGRPFTRLHEEGSRVAGVALGDEVIEADRVLIAAGSWTQHILPFMAPHLRSVGQPVFHLRPADPAPYRAERFPVFGADISQTGYYGFPVNADGVVKIANHGPGRSMHPGGPERVVTDGEERALRAFLLDTFPGLAEAPIVYRRVCVYGDTLDEHFWIAADPDREGLVVAAGGSGHGFKFAPVLGDWIADAVMGRENPALEKFRWRPDVRPGKGEEAARAHG